ncbi:armadillo-type protein [Hyaloraphidium curvatum]|nr:armadillo-type protein [Hyaloraphidium curvatum]
MPAPTRDRALAAAVTLLGLVDLSRDVKGVPAAPDGLSRPALTRLQRVALLCSAAMGAPSCAALAARACKFIADESRLWEKDAAVAMELVEGGAVDLALHVLRRPASPANLWARVQAATALGNIGGSSSPEAKAAIADAGGLALLLRCLEGACRAEERDRGTAELAMQLCRAVGNLCYGTDMVGPMERKAMVASWPGSNTDTPADGDRQPSEASDALHSRTECSIADDHLHSGPPLVMTGPTLLLLAITTFPDPRVRRWACHAVSHATYGRAPSPQQDAFLAAGCLEAVLDVAAGEDGKARTAACEAVGSMVFRHSEACRRAADKGAVGTLVRALEGALEEGDARAAEAGLLPLESILREVPSLAYPDTAARLQAVAAGLSDSLGPGSPGVRRWANAVLLALEHTPPGAVSSSDPSKD